MGPQHGMARQMQVKKLQEMPTSKITSEKASEIGANVPPERTARMSRMKLRTLGAAREKRKVAMPMAQGLSNSPRQQTGPAKRPMQIIGAATRLRMGSMGMKVVAGDGDPTELSEVATVG